MPEIAEPVTGTFCWLEANLEDPAKATGFYGELFGWAFQEMPMPNGATYRIAHRGGKHVAGLTQLPDAAKKMGAPPHWLSYVAVDDVARSADRAKSLGGKILAPPMQVGPGTMAVVQDPTGGVFALWNTKQSMGTFLHGEESALCWNELATGDVAAAKKFYSELFGWTMEAFPMPDFEYTVVKSGDVMVGGIMPKPEQMKDAPPQWSVYIAVGDCDATLERAKKLGAKVIAPPMDIPDVGRFAAIADPQGAAISFIKNAEKPAG